MTVVIEYYLHSFAVSNMPVLGKAFIMTLGTQRLPGPNMVPERCLAAIRTLSVTSIEQSHAGYHKYPKYHAFLKAA